MKYPWLIWIPRVLVILLALFMLLMSADSFEGNGSLGSKLLGFFIHNIPTLVLAIIIWLTWHRPLIAALIFVAMGAAFAIAFETYNRWDTFLTISGAPILAGLLFLLEHFRQAKKTKTTPNP